MQSALHKPEPVFLKNTALLEASLKDGSLSKDKFAVLSDHADEKVSSEAEEDRVSRMQELVEAAARVRRGEARVVPASSERR